MDNSSKSIASEEKWDFDDSAINSTSVKQESEAEQEKEKLRLAQIERQNNWDW